MNSARNTVCTRSFVLLCFFFSFHSSSSSSLLCCCIAAIHLNPNTCTPFATAVLLLGMIKCICIDGFTVGLVSGDVNVFVSNFLLFACIGAGNAAELVPVCECMSVREAIKSTVLNRVHNFLSRAQDMKMYIYTRLVLFQCVLLRTIYTWEILFLSILCLFCFCICFLFSIFKSFVRIFSVVSDHKFVGPLNKTLNIVFENVQIITQYFVFHILFNNTMFRFSFMQSEAFSMVCIWFHKMSLKIMCNFFWFHTIKLLLKSDMEIVVADFRQFWAFFFFHLLIFRLFFANVQNLWWNRSTTCMYRFRRYHTHSSVHVLKAISDEQQT